MRKLIIGALMSVVVLSGCDKGKDLPPAEKLALFKAVEAGDAEALKKALDAGVSPNLYHSERGYLVVSAVWPGHERLLRMLIDAGADVNAKKEEGDGPLIAAMLGGDCEATQMLLRAGANPNEVFTRKQAAAAALGDEYFDKTARELYVMNKQKSLQSPANAWEKNEACWLEVEHLMK